ncbi:glycine--tRNA ligase [Candidatus Woesearchaeota archaeon]|nr:glycine--tRNA ligase [Candidatus Woesearchaeota archaeon]
MVLNIDDMAAFCKKKGLIYPSGEIYGGLAGFFDYGPYGSEMKLNIKNSWWKYHVRDRSDIVGIDGSIITNPSVWKASGHVDKFVDYGVVNKKTKEKFKVDAHELKNYENNSDYAIKGKINPMFVTNVGPMVDDSVEVFLRPETAQLIFTNFKLTTENARLKLPFGIAQMGRAFRNEISPRNFIFRCREFEQLEIEYFVHPVDKNCPFFKDFKDFKFNVCSISHQKKDVDLELMTASQAVEKGLMQEWHAYWLAFELNWFKSLGCSMDNFRVRQHAKDELAHYSSDCWDLEYNFPFGWKELEGIADRGDYDLSRHIEFSKTDLSLFDEEQKKKIIPHVVAEPSLGVDRAFLVFLYEAYNDDKKRGNVVLKLHPKIAPIQVAVMPLVKNKELVRNKAAEVFNQVKENFNAFYDESGSIGRRYARMDEIGTPYCVTIDFDTLEDGCVTVRNRDNTEQKRVKIVDLNKELFF